MPSTAIGLAIGGAVLLASMMLFVYMWNTYYMNYIVSFKSIAEKINYLSKSKIDLNASIIERGSNARLNITIYNVGSTSINIDGNSSIIYIKCVKNNEVVWVKLHKLKGTKILEPGDHLSFIISLRRSTIKSCSSIRIVFVNGDGVLGSTVLSLR
ncbi:hypothetical protein PYJP_15650 [Pyrofollis japonicus]|uniref:hypothetical protein n=1 Tax=Pyrofollis japonicus TaxID=3060460 RepID=UPI00295A9897|nr:hypothetical protein [Pyrofollis japonicus]BEP18213.1 hypothetical protein PYJP_15650 [Pyrofollis japonicus]